MSYIINLDLDICALDFGQAPCQAVGAAGTECYNTWESCKDRNNYKKSIRTVSFTSDSKTYPNAVPCVKSVDFSPSLVYPHRGLGEREKATLTFQDFPLDDFFLDKYHNTRLLDTTGSFFARLIERKAFFIGREIRINELLFFVESIQGPDANGKVRMVVKDPLKILDAKFSNAPALSRGELAETITDSANSLTITPLDVFNDYPESISNTLLHSGDIGNIVWNKAGATVQTNVIDNHLGNQVADAFIPNNGVAGATLLQVVPAVNRGQPIILSWYVSVDTPGIAIEMRIYEDSQNDYVYASFDMDTGEVITSGESSNRIDFLAAGSVENIGPEGRIWYRVWLQYEMDHALADIPTVEMQVLNQGDGSIPLYIWGAMHDLSGDLHPLLPTVDTIAVLDTHFIRLGDEIIHYMNRDPDTGVISGLSRGQWDTFPEEHQAGTHAQLCLAFDNFHILDVIYLLVGYRTTFPIKYLDLAGWEALRALLPNTRVTRIISSPTSVNELINDILKDTLSLLVWDRKNELLRFFPWFIPIPGPKLFTRENIKAFNIDWGQTIRYSRMWYSFYMIRETFTRVNIKVDLDFENPNAFGSPVIYKHEAKWVRDNAVAETTASDYFSWLKSRPLFVLFEVDASVDIRVAEVVLIQMSNMVDENGEANPRYFQIAGLRPKNKFSVLEATAFEVPLYETPDEETGEATISPSSIIDGEFSDDTTLVLKPSFNINPAFTGETYKYQNHLGEPIWVTHTPDWETITQVTINAIIDEWTLDVTQTVLRSVQPHNLLIWSEQYENNIYNEWGSTYGAIDVIDPLAPDGTPTADEVFGQVIASTWWETGARRVQVIDFDIPTDTDITFSFYAHQRYDIILGRGFLGLWLGTLSKEGGGPAGLNPEMNVFTGAIGTGRREGDADLVIRGLRSIPVPGTLWHRYVFQATTTGDFNLARGRMAAGVSTVWDFNEPEFDGKPIYVWGLQLTLSEDVMEYVKTEGTPVEPFPVGNILELGDITAATEKARTEYAYFNPTGEVISKPGANQVQVSDPALYQIGAKVSFQNTDENIFTDEYEIVDITADVIDVFPAIQSDLPPGTNIELIGFTNIPGYWPPYRIH